MVAATLLGAHARREALGNLPYTDGCPRLREPFAANGELGPLVERSWLLLQRQSARRCRATMRSSSGPATAAVLQRPASRAWVCAWRSSSRGDFGGPATFRSRPRHAARQHG